MADDEDGEPLIDINTTPLIDVMLVLLIMLIVTIPLRTDAVRLDIGRAPPTSETAPPPIVALDIAADGAVSWDGKVVTGREELEALMRTAATVAVPPVMHVRPDPQAAYEPVAAVLATAQRQGVSRIGIVERAR